MTKPSFLKRFPMIAIVLFLLFISFAWYLQRPQFSHQSVTSWSRFFSVPSTMPIHPLEYFMQYVKPNPDIEYSMQLIEPEQQTLPRITEVQPLPLSPDNFER